jgi:ribonuclease III
MENNNEIEIEKKNPYNFNNKLLNIDFIKKILYEFDINEEPNNIDLYQSAFIHKSYSTKKNPIEEIVEKPEGALELMDIDNERLEFLGDSVLGFVIAKYSYERFEDQNEGFLTRIKTKLVNGEALSYFSKELGFGEYILMSRFVEDKCNGRKSVKILEDVFESFIGALYLDFNEKELPDYDFYSGIGFHICEKFLINLIEEKVDFADLIKNDYNYKDQLLRYYQQTYHKPPKYELVSSEQLENEKSFIINVLDEKGEILCTGSGKSKKKAEQNGSKNALIKLNIITDE